MKRLNLQQRENDVLVPFELWKHVSTIYTPGWFSPNQEAAQLCNILYIVITITHATISIVQVYIFL